MKKTLLRTICMAIAVMLCIGNLNAQMHSLPVMEKFSVEQTRDGWLTWAKDPVKNVIGTGGIDFGIYHRYAVSDLTDYVGSTITKIKYQPYNHTQEPTVFTSNPRLQIYVGGSATGGNYVPGTLAVDYTVPSYTFTNQTVDLPVPFEIPAGKEVWIGIFYSLTAGYPATCTDPNGTSSYVEGKSNVMFIGGGEDVWGTTADFFNAPNKYCFTHAAWVVSPIADCDPAKNLNVEYTADCKAELTWSAPNAKKLSHFNTTTTEEIFPENPIDNSVVFTSHYSVNERPESFVGATNSDRGNWMKWCDSNNDAIGTGAPVTFSVGARFDVADLAASGIVSGDELSKVKFVPYYVSASTFTIQIYQGATTLTNPGTKVHEQLVTQTLTNEVYNEVTLTNPVAIDPTKELWIVYKVVHTGNNHPAGCDAGPRVPNKGDMMLYGSTSWSTLYAITQSSPSGPLNLNWNIEAYCGSAPQPGEFSYNVYRDGVKIATTDKEFYTDGDFDSKVEHTWGVRVACNTGNESNPITKKMDACFVPEECLPPTKLQVTFGENCSGANLTWEAPTKSPTRGMVDVTLEAGDVWGDGSGYQMLIGPTSLWGNVIPASGILGKCADPPSYEPFTYKIPANADANCTTNNIVINKKVTIQLEAGEYAYCIANPSYDSDPNYSNFWIAAGDNGRKASYKFEEGKKYNFKAVMNGQNDAIEITVKDVPVERNYNIYRDGVLIKEDHAGTTYTDTGIVPNTEHTWEVKRVCGIDNISTPATKKGKCILEGINENTKATFSIVPNPATDNVTITAGNSFHTIEVLSFLGQVVLSQPNSGITAQMDISNLTNGVYFVRIISENGTSVQKFVKQ